MRVFGTRRLGAAGSAIVLATALFASTLCVGQARAADTVLDAIVATVNGKIITQFDLDERLRPIYEQMRGRTLSSQEYEQIRLLKRQILDQMIDDILIIQDSERYKLKISDSEIEDQIKAFREKRELSEEAFSKQLALQGMTRADFARNMKRDMIKHRLLGGVVSSKVVVTDTEVEQEYAQRKAEYSKGSMVQLALILLPAGLKASELKANIEAGQLTFAQAADKYSQGPGAGTGGDIGFIGWKDLAPEWSEALRGLKPGQIAQPVHIQDFEGLLQVVSLKEGEDLALEAVREQIYQSLHEGKYEKVFKDYMRRQREKAVIEYRNM